MDYDTNNIFAKILRREIPCDVLFESDYTLSFKDITPKAPVHILVIPKGAYMSFADFSANASDIEIVDFNRTVGKVAEAAGCASDGYRLISNCGTNAHQEVPHFHVHILGGAPLNAL